MKSRCRTESASGFENYGGRGIGYCDRWKHFRFFAEDMFPTFQFGLTLDRIDNDQGYSPDNCKWSTRSEQSDNRRIFKNNSVGNRGVEKTSLGFKLRVQVDGDRYNLGRFHSTEEADKFRADFLNALSTDVALAMQMIERRARLDSSTSIRGVTRAKSGFVVRKTIAGERKYLGHSTTLSGAIKLLSGAAS